MPGPAGRRRPVPETARPSDILQPCRDASFVLYSDRTIAVLGHPAIRSQRSGHTGVSLRIVAERQSSAAHQRQPFATSGSRCTRTFHAPGRHGPGARRACRRRAANPASTCPWEIRAPASGGFVWPRSKQSVDRQDETTLLVARDRGPAIRAGPAGLKRAIRSWVKRLARGHRCRRRSNCSAIQPRWRRRAADLRQWRRRRILADRARYQLLREAICAGHRERHRASRPAAARHRQGAGGWPPAGQDPPGLDTARRPTGRRDGDRACACGRNRRQRPRPGRVFTPDDAAAAAPGVARAAHCLARRCRRRYCRRLVAQRPCLPRHDRLYRLEHALACRRRIGPGDVDRIATRPVRCVAAASMFSPTFAAAANSARTGARRRSRPAGSAPWIILPRSDATCLRARIISARRLGIRCWTC